MLQNNLINKGQSLIRKLNWQDFILIGVIIFFLFLQINLVRQYEQLPSPLYGGDNYLQRGMVTHVAEGGSPFENYRNSDVIPNYLPLYAAIVGGSARMLNMEPTQTMFTFSYFFIVIGIVILYILGCVLFKDKTIAIFFSLICTHFSLIIKYTNFTKVVIFPLFFLFLFLTLAEKRKKQKWIYASITGLVYGLASISHGTMFPSLTIFLFLVFFYLFFFKYLRRENKKTLFNQKKWKMELKTNFITFFLMFFIGLVIAQLYWYPIIKKAILGDTTTAALHLYMSVTEGYQPLSSLFKFLFFNYSSLFNASITLLFCASLLLLFLLKKHNISTKYLLIVFFGAIFVHVGLVIASKFLNIDVNTVLSYMTHVFWVPLTVGLVCVFSIFVIFRQLKQANKLIYYAVILVLFILVCTNQYLTYNDYVTENKWHKVGKTSLSPHLMQIAEHIQKNTGVYDVILTNKELAFSINALTGRKFVANPAGQKNLLYDFNARECDLAVLLYGNASAPRAELFKKYGVKYFYWDSYWIQSEFQFDKQGKIVSLFDPIEVFNTEENKKLFDKYDIPYSEEHLEINPNKRGRSPKFDVLLVKPNFNLTHPWDKSLDKYLELQKEIKLNNQPVVRFYKVIY